MLATAQPPPIVHDGDEEEDSLFVSLSLALLASIGKWTPFFCVRRPV